MAILAIERLDLLSAVGKIKTSVRQNAVDIKYDCPDIPGFFQYMLHVITTVVPIDSAGRETNRRKKSAHPAQGL
jgi:hypothetical protein